MSASYCTRAAFPHTIASDWGNGPDTDGLSQIAGPGLEARVPVSVLQ